MEPNILSAIEDYPTLDNQVLWDRAYLLVKKEDEGLVTEYENLLLKEYGQETTSHTSEQGNVWNSMEPIHRQKILHIMIQKGLRQMDENRTKYTMFGREFVPRKQLRTAAKFVQRAKALVDEAVNVSREASLAWAGICVILPILTNTFEAEQDNQDGFIYVTSRVPVYVALLKELSKRTTTQLKRPIEEQIVVICQYIIEYQLRTVVRLYMKKLERAKDDILRAKGWKEMVSRIKDSETLLDGDLHKLNDNSIIETMEKLRADAVEVYHEITSLVSVPRADSIQHHSGSGDNNYVSGTMYTSSSTGSGFILNNPSFQDCVTFGGN